MSTTDDLTKRVERMAGKRIAQRRKPSGGYSIATREIITFDDGSSAFIKAGRNIPNSALATWIRREHRVYQTLTGDFLARLLAFDDDGVEPILMLEDLSHAHWPPPWQTPHIDAVLAALKQVAPQAFNDARPLRYATQLIHSWQVVADDPGPFLSLAACRRKEHRTRIFRINADLKQTFIKKSAKISAQSVRVPFGFSVASPTGC